ncbi:hypothetical protein GF406_13735 [candidate division KSB1 bacterium]|jgi:hypothetical protein|nr:hypothetical protein [candidate division KSB1 bacterium]
MKQVMFIFMFLLILPGLLLAQYKTDTNPINIAQAISQPVNAGKAAMGILGLDPSKLHISHSYQMNVGSLGGNAFSQGLYLNTLTYQFNIPLTMSVQWGIAHQPFQTGNVALMNDGPFISNASLVYRPSKSTVLSIEYATYPTNYYGYGMTPRYNRGW